MKPSLQFRLSQHLTLTPQLQQSIRLLQLSTVELNQEIDRLLMDNPALEREDAEGEPEAATAAPAPPRSEEHTSELQSHSDLVCRLLLEKKKHNTSERPLFFSHNDANT